MAKPQACSEDVVDDIADSRVPDCGDSSNLDPAPFDLQSDDPMVFGRVVRRYQKSLFGFFGRMGFSQADADDLAQETFLRAWRNRFGFDPQRAQVSTWLFAIVYNASRDEFKRAARRPLGGDELVDIAGPDC